MPLDIFAAQDAAMAGVQIFQKWQRDWLAQWLKPLMDMVEALQTEQVVNQWELLDPQLKEFMEKQYPEEYAKAEKIISDLKKGKRNAPDTGPAGSGVTRY